jgi:hypothetical protein
MPKLRLVGDDHDPSSDRKKVIVTPEQREKYEDAARRLGQKTNIAACRPDPRGMVCIQRGNGILGADPEEDAVAMAAVLLNAALGKLEVGKELQITVEDDEGQ